MDYKAIIIDIDMTLVDSLISEQFRKQRNWSMVYKLIPEFKVHPEIPIMLSELIELGFQIAVVSSSPRPYCEKILAHYDFPYKALVAYHDTQMHKPHIQPFVKALSSIQSDPSLCVSLGDDVKDVIAAKNSGIGLNVGCIWYVDNSHDLISNGASFIARTPLDLIDYLSKK